MANKKYDIPNNDDMMVAESAPDYGITIPVTVPSTGGYSVEYLKKELTNFALKLLHPQTQEKAKNNRIHISERIKALSAVPASSSMGDYKDDFVSVMSDKY